MIGVLSQAHSQSFQWTWVNGDTTAGLGPNYGTLGVANTSNFPGARYSGVTFNGSSGSLWLFGGGSGSSGQYFSDLWKWDGTDWTWMSGNNTLGAAGNYGTRGVASAVNLPGGKEGHASWSDGSNTFWMFGGYGQDGNGNVGYMNDLWKFNGSNWSWESGDSVYNQKGQYNNKGLSSSSSKPGARFQPHTWTDLSGNLWLFGGEGFDGNGNLGQLNDLWKYDGSHWTWVAGDSTTNHYGVYSTKGVASSSNNPGGRRGGCTWRDGNDILWLFGGNGYAETGGSGGLNDLWKWDGKYWTWVAGSKAVNANGMYLGLDSASSETGPGAKEEMVSWTDAGNNLWLMGGDGGAEYNDLWKFDGSFWSWQGGDSTPNASGVYNTMGTPSPANVPGARQQGLKWDNNSGVFWLYGGFGYGGGSYNRGPLGDLWKYDATAQVTEDSTCIKTKPTISASLTHPSSSTSTDGSIEIDCDNDGKLFRYARWNSRKGSNYPAETELDLIQAATGTYYLMLISTESCIWYFGPYDLAP